MGNYRREWTKGPKRRAKTIYEGPSMITINALLSSPWPHLGMPNIYRQLYMALNSVCRNVAISKLYLFYIVLLTRIAIGSITKTKSERYYKVIKQGRIKQLRLFVKLYMILVMMMFFELFFLSSQAGLAPTTFSSPVRRSRTMELFRRRWLNVGWVYTCITRRTSS